MDVFQYKTARIHYRKYTVDEAVLNHSFENDIFYKGIPEYKKVDGVVVDIGAHIGTFSVYSVISKHARVVYAIEPNKDSYQVLAKNVVENDLSDRIRPLNFALAESNGRSRLYLDRENWGHSITNSELGVYEEITSVTFQKFLESEQIDFCDLVKFNCEGAEFQIILSMKENQLKRIGMMLILFHEDMVKSNLRYEDIVSFLSKNNFLIRLSHLKGKRGWIVAKNKNRYSWISHNIFCFQEYLNERVKHFSIR